MRAAAGPKGDALAFCTSLDSLGCAMSFPESSWKRGGWDFCVDLSDLGSIIGGSRVFEADEESFFGGSEDFASLSSSGGDLGTFSEASGELEGDLDALWDLDVVADSLRPFGGSLGTFAGASGELEGDLETFWDLGTSAEASGELEGDLEAS